MCVFSQKPINIRFGPHKEQHELTLLGLFGPHKEQRELRWQSDLSHILGLKYIHAGYEYLKKYAWVPIIPA